MKTPKLQLAATIFFYLIFVVAYGAWFNIREERQLLRNIDDMLMTAATSIKYMLEPDFHDRAVGPDSISWEEIEKNRMAVSEFTFETDFEYIYTLIEKEGAFYFTAPTVTPEEYEERKSWYFYPYDDVPDSFREALGENRPIYDTYTDQWGTFRSIALPQSSPGGNRYLACADYEISYISDIIVHNYTTSLLTALFFMIFTIPFILTYRKTLVEHTRELVSMNNELRKYRNHLQEMVEHRTADLEVAKQKAEEANRLKSRLLFNVSHELRTPLNGITGYCEAISDATDIVLAHKYSDIIQNESDILLALINDLLDLAKIESGKMTITASPFHIRNFIRDTLRGQAVIADKKNLAFSWSVADDLPVYLCGDGLRIRQVLLNLVSNAVKFTRKGSVDIVVEALQRHDDTVPVRFTVRDTGMGIPKEKQEIIFESFTQADPSITRSFGGTGLGVSIASQLVELMNGELELESKVGKGSCFSFILPLDICSPTKEEIQALSANRADGDERSLSGRGDILLVDDYPTNLEILSLFLKSAGYNPVTASNGIQAVEMSEKNDFACIFMDIQMPGIDGFETAQRIRHSGTVNARKPIIGLSASLDESTRKKCADSGMNGFLLKPVKKNRLLSLTSYWAERSRLHEEEEHEESAEENKTGSIDVINYTKAMENFESDRDLFLSALEMFTRQMPERTEIFTTAAEKGDLESLFREAHKMKGSAALLGLEELYNLAGDLEKAGRNHSREDVPGILQDMKAAVERYYEESRRYLEGDKK